MKNETKFKLGQKVLVIKNVGQKRFDQYIGTLATVVEVELSSVCTTVRMLDRTYLTWQNTELQELSELGNAIYGK